MTEILPISPETHRKSLGYHFWSECQELMLSSVKGGKVVLVSRVAELLLLIIAVVSFMSSIALSRESGSAYLPALLIAILSSIGVYLLHKRIKRLTAPKPVTIPAELRGPLKIYIGKRRLMMWAAGTLMFLAPAPFMFEGGKYGVAIACGVFGVLFLLALLSDLKKIGTPYLVLDDQGMITYEYGRIPWSDVDNVLLQVRQNRGSKLYLLGLSVYEPEKYFKRMGFLLRLFKMKWLELPSERDQLRISISMLSHEPLYIDAVVKHFRALYARSIGITPITGDLSKDKKLSEIDRLMNSLRSENSIEKLESATTKIDALDKEVQQEFREDFVRIRKGIIKSSIYAGIGLVFIVFIIMYKFLSR